MYSAMLTHPGCEFRKVRNPYEWLYIQALSSGEEMSNEFKWKVTRAALGWEQDSIGSRMNSECIELLKKLNKLRPPSKARPDPFITGDNVAAALMIVRFEDGTSAADPYVRAQFAGGDAYAFVYPISAEGIPGGPVYWRPGDFLQGTSVDNWLAGAVLHETLHTMGFFDEELLDVVHTFDPFQDLSSTDAISVFLAKQCF